MWKEINKEVLLSRRISCSQPPLNLIREADKQGGPPRISCSQPPLNLSPCGPLKLRHRSVFCCPPSHSSCVYFIQVPKSIMLVFGTWMKYK